MGGREGLVDTAVKTAETGEKKWEKVREKANECDFTTFTILIQSNDSADLPIIYNTHTHAY